MYYMYMSKGSSLFAEFKTHSVIPSGDSYSMEHQETFSCERNKYRAPLLAVDCLWKCHSINSHGPYGSENQLASFLGLPRLSLHG